MDNERRTLKDISADMLEWVFKAWWKIGAVSVLLALYSLTPLWFSGIAGVLAAVLALAVVLGNVILVGTAGGVIAWELIPKMAKLAHRGDFYETVKTTDGNERSEKRKFVEHFFGIAVLGGLLIFLGVFFGWLTEVSSVAFVMVFGSLSWVLGLFGKAFLAAAVLSLVYFIGKRIVVGVLAFAMWCGRMIVSAPEQVRSGRKAVGRGVSGATSGVRSELNRGRDLVREFGDAVQHSLAGNSDEQEKTNANG